jgi:Uma2 family endonuclease
MEQMMVALRQHPHDYDPIEEYLAFERASEVRHELINGAIVMMAGANNRHNLIVSSTNIALGSQLRKRLCATYTQDMKVISPSGQAAYPDIIALCGKPKFRDEKEDVLLNPNVIIEVLSPSTESFDRGDKFHHYRSIPSFQEYLLISRDMMRVEQFTRNADNSWQLRAYLEPHEVVTLASIDCTLLLEDINEKVIFGDEA